MRRRLAALALAALSGTAWGQDKPAVLRWLVQDLPPHFSYHEGRPPQRPEDLGQGEVDGFLRLLIARLPQYRHEFIEAGLPRFEALVRQGETVCSLLHVRTPERLQWLYFTHLYPALASRQIHVIVRQDQLHRFASTDGQPLQLAELLQHQDLSGLLPRNRSFGPRIDQLLKAAGEQGPKTLALGRSTHVLAMLKAGRMDHTLEYPGVVDEFQHSHPDGAELARLPLAEGRSTALATAACSRNPAGRQAIAAIDQVVRQLAAAAQREAWLRQWRPEGLEPEDRQRLQRNLDERARGPAQIE
jgi:uncharacterized protein (TIGR02285 family)